MFTRSFAVLLVLSCLTVQARAEGARYLIICPEAFNDAIAPLAEWKSRKGMQAYVANLDETGYTSWEIQQYIMGVANNWDPAPEYVLLVGESSQVPYYDSYGDVGYGSVDGDMFVDVHPGRFPATSPTQVEVMVEKVLAHERTPTTDEGYYRSAALMVARDHDDDDWLHYFGDAYWEAGLMSAAGFDHVQILSSSIQPDASAVFRQMLADGLAYGVFHGQIYGWSTYNGNPEQLNNGPMLPVMLVYTCGGGSYGSQWVQAGTPGNLSGAVGYVGQITSCSHCAHWRSALRRGFWEYVFEDSGPRDIVTFGGAVESGRLNYYEEIHATSEYTASFLTGDPELNLWTGVPETVVVNHPPSVPRGEFELTVSITVAGQPRAGALVGVMGDIEAYGYGYSDEDGHVTLELDATADDVLTITATGRDLRPYEAEMEVGGIAVGDDDDTSGDDDTASDDDTAGTDDDDNGEVITDPIQTEPEVNPGDCSCGLADGRGACPAIVVAVLAGMLVRRRRRA